MKKITIKDVAREAGVSISTVSNALNNVDVLTPETKEQVLATAKSLNYFPNLRGKLLKSGKSNMIGFFTSSVNGPYFYALIESMSRECEKQGYGLNVFVTKNKDVVLNNIFGGMIDGTIIFEQDLMTDQDVNIIDKEGIATIFLDREIKSKRIGSVVFDSYTAGFEATKYLIDLGHKKIAFISGFEEMYDSRQRKAGYLDAMEQFGLEVKPHYILEGLFEEESAYKAVKAFYKKYKFDFPDGFLAGNDLSAIGCIKALTSDGWKVPKDISVMGFDDIEIAEYYKPALTTVRNPISRQGILAIRHLLDIMTQQSEGEIHRLPGTIIGRDSCIVSTTISE
ncbi:LacI family DNA-binding transcriptional regulator [Jeotgalibaca caeni]|uniref:LacI family DNA-binding transcriptional regulator n=1 Tax=Jeotgalibaca caeni TaxID=3028623 RepID=UPI00237E4294|nr:LacI family DNA-binding transcriptional regulator [Jeotgalibaca caeni]MDE1549693.1 LacI family DNA-binding transcriptional regulator [Jeotgalibaca caeni]